VKLPVSSFVRVCGAAALVFLAGAAASAPRLPEDVKGSADPALVQRFAGSVLIGYRAEDWDTARLPTSPAIDRAAAGKPFKDLATVEGRRTRAVYLAPEGKTPAEVYRNHEQALVAAGLKKKFACESRCDDAFFALRALAVEEGLAWAPGAIPAPGGGSFNVPDAIAFEEGRLLVGTLPRPGGEAWVMVYVSKAVNGSTRYAQAFVETVEPRAMATGQVKVLAAADIQAGLRADGKVAFYGLYFDSGKAELEPESRPQLDEMARLLKSQPSLQAFVVGHTDGQGALESNLQLSQARAQAVVDALQRLGIAASRLAAKGVASLAPVATNASDEGRARNRRVELVVR